MSDDEKGLAATTLGIGCIGIILGCLVWDLGRMPMTALSMIAMGAVLIWTALSEAGRDE